MRKNKFFLALRRPLFIAFILGCTVSLITSATLTARLVFPAAICWSFIPFVQIASVAAVVGKERFRIPFTDVIDRFFSGYTPWLIWLAGLSTIWILLSPFTNPRQSIVGFTWLYAGTLTATVWSLYLDYRFFKRTFARTPARASRDLLIQRLISWSAILLIIGAPTVWSETVGRIIR